MCSRRTYDSVVQREDPDATVERIAELEAEVARLQSEVRALRAKNAELLRVSAERDFEKPPHY